MKTSDFQFDLPENLIALYPAATRTGSRLLHVNIDQQQHAELADLQFTDLFSLLRPGDLLVLNDTKVIPARLFGQKSTGGKVEVLVERVLSEHQVLAHVRSSKSPQPNTQLLLADELEVTVIDRQDDLFILDFNHPEPIFDLLQQYGQTPLPPYIERELEAMDQERYQTVYARELGAVAAPTAGLHFDEAMLEKLTQHNIDLAYVTLHVGAGTFAPVRVDNIHEHRMHSEYMELDQNVCEKVNETKAKRGRVIAVGTTAVRCLETATHNNKTQTFKGDTDIFIYPGYEFKCVDAMITNFHIPDSTLIMLISAFAGLKNTKDAYAHAIEKQYRFYSYGDAMFLTR